MVTNDGDFGRTGMGLAEHDAPLVVGADGMKSGKPAFEGLKAVAGWQLEIVQGCGLVHLDLFPHGDAGDGGETMVQR